MQPSAHHHSARIPAGAVLVVCALALLIIAAVLAWLWREWTILEITVPWLTTGIRAAIPLLFLAGIVEAGAILWRKHGARESVTARNQAIVIRAQVQVAPHATSFTYHPQPPIIEQAETLALPAPIEVVKPLDTWMRWVDEQPHCLLGGRTKAGKTTAACAILARRLRNREPCFIIDPHSSGWMGLPTAGSVANEGELRRALGAILALYIGRMKERDEYKRKTGQELPHNHWPRITVLIDEANGIADELQSDWQTFCKQVASGSRKVGISLLVLAQSPLVEDLKISGAMRENFARLALDDRTVQMLIDTCREKERKAALQDALIGLDYPAAATIGAQVWILDRDGLDGFIEPADAHTLVWDGWDFAAGAAVGDVQPAIDTLPAAVGAVRLSWCVAKMIDRGKDHGEIARTIASLLLKAAPGLNRVAVEAEIERRAAQIAASGNAAQIGKQLDRDELLRACLDVGAGVSMALQIYGGNSNKFFARARQLELDSSR